MAKAKTKKKASPVKIPVQKLPNDGITGSIPPSPNPAGQDQLKRVIGVVHETMGSIVVKQEENHFKLSMCLEELTKLAPLPPFPFPKGPEGSRPEPVQENDSLLGQLQSIREHQCHEGIILDYLLNFLHETL